MNQILWYMLAGTRGGETRMRIVSLVKDRPKNAHQIAKELMLDYKTVQHHLRMLVKHNILATINQNAYGAGYYVDLLIDKTELDKILGLGSNLGKSR